MAAFDFPSSPSNGDNYTANGVTWSWDGSAWTETGDLSTSRYYVTKHASTTAGFAVGGENPGFSPYEVSSSEEFSFDDFQIKTLTTS